MPPEERRRIGVGPYVMAGVVLLLVLVPLFPRTFLRGEILLPAGLLFQYPPWSEYPIEDRAVADNFLTIESFLMFNMFYTATDLALDYGEWPLWNPLEFGGMPLLANYQSAVMYPPRLMHVFMDRYVATTLYVVLKLWLCGFCAFLCARVFGLRPLSAMIPAVAWMLSGYNTTWAYWADPDVAAWLPLQLASAELLARRDVRRGAVLMALSSTLMLLGGHPESAFTMSAGTGIYFFIRLIGTGTQAWPPMAGAAIAWAFALAITAPQTLPFLEYLPESQTFASRADETGLDLHFFPGSAWICLFVPRFFGADLDGNFWTSSAENQNFVIMAYGGIAVWVLALCAFVKPRRWGIGVLIALCVPTILSVALAVDAPFIGLIHKLPLLESVWGCWFLGFPMFVLALLAGFGWEQILERNLTRRGIGILAAVVVTIGLLCAATYMFNRSLMDTNGVLPYVTFQVAVAAGVCALSVALLALGATLGNRRWVSFAAIVLVGGDLVWAARDLHPSAPHHQVLFETNLTNILSQQPVRVHAVEAGIPTGLLQAYGIEQFWGYDGIMPARWWRFVAETQPPSLAERMAGVQYVLTMPDAEPRGLPIDGVGLHERSDALPRAFLSRSVVTVDDDDTIFERMRADDFDPEEVVYTTVPVTASFEEYEGDLGGTRIALRSPNTVVIDVEANSTCALVLSDAFYPGWSVTIDQVPAELFPAYHAMRGVIVPAGPHRIEFRYAPTVFRTGLWISIVAMGVSILGCAAMLSRRRGE